MACPVQGGRSGRIEGSLITAAPLASTDAGAIAAKVEALRRQRFTGKHIAAEVGVSPATVSRILKRLGLNRMRRLDPAEPVRRYERDHPGELIHIDIKKLGRFERVGHRITGDRTDRASPGRWLGYPPHLHRRRFPARLSEILDKDAKRALSPF